MLVLRQSQLRAVRSAQQKPAAKPSCCQLSPLSPSLPPHKLTLARCRLLPVHAIPGNGSQGDGGSMEQVLLEELIASRKQVDRLLDQQGLLLSLIAAPPSHQLQAGRQEAIEAPSQAQPTHTPPPSQPHHGQLQPTPLNGSASTHAHSASPAHRPASSSRNSVQDVLLQTGALSAATLAREQENDTVLPSIKAALNAVVETDVLSDMPIFPTSFSRTSKPESSAAQPSGQQSSAQPIAAESAQPSATAPVQTLTAEAGAGQAQAGPIKIVPQPELPCSGVSLTGKGGEIVPLPILRLGDASAFWVEILQVALMAHGFVANEEAIVFGHATESALKRFQASHQLPLTGSTNAETWATLISELSQLRQDITHKVASGAAAKVVEWGRTNAGSSMVSSPNPTLNPAHANGTALSSSLSGSAHSSSPAINGASVSSPVSNGSAMPINGSRVNSSFSANSANGVNGNSSFNPTSNGNGSVRSGSSSSVNVGGVNGVSSSSENSGPVGVNFFTDISSMAAEEMEQQQGGGHSSNAMHSNNNNSHAGSKNVSSSSHSVATTRPDANANNSSSSMGPLGPAHSGSSFSANGYGVSSDSWGGHSSSVNSNNIPAPHVTGSLASSIVNSKRAPVSNSSDSNASISSNNESRTPASSNTTVSNNSTAPVKSNSSNSVSSNCSTMPELAMGEDNIEWVSVLHRGLEAAGYHASEEEEENWLFGEGTQEALLTFQACSGLPETGIVCARTWDVLLQGDEELKAEAHARAARTAAQAAGDVSNSAYSEQVSSEAWASQGPVQGSVGENNEQDEEGWMEDEETAQALSGISEGSKWPVLTENEGGREVQLLQLALRARGFYCGEDDMQYWMFGEMTRNAVLTFQSCAGLKETGACDEAVWKALLGSQTSPSDLPRIRQELVDALIESGELDENFEDITEGTGVWLLGEQRFETKL